MFKSLRQPLFNVDGGMGGAADGGSGSVTSSSDLPGTPGWGLPNGGNQAAAPTTPQASPEAAAPVQQAPQGQLFDFSGRKIEVADPTIAAALKDVHKDYSALQGTYTQTTQRVKELEQANQTYMGILQQMQQRQPEPAAPEPAQSQQPTAEDMEQMKAEFMDKFYENPMSAIEGMLDSMFQQKVNPIIEPIQQEKAWNSQVKALQEKYPDEFSTLIGPMQQLLQDMPELAQHGLESVFQLAKRSQPTPQPGPEQLLNDPQFVQQFMQRPEIEQQFLSRYMQDKNNQQAPPTIGGQPGGQLPVTPEIRPTDIKTGTKALKQFLGLS